MRVHRVRHVCPCPNGMWLARRHIWAAFVACCNVQPACTPGGLRVGWVQAGLGADRARKVGLGVYVRVVLYVGQVSHKGVWSSGMILA